MPGHDVFALGRSRFNDFLFASVGTEANGHVLTVLSMFARLGRDPWQEAHRLTGLSQPEVTNSLARSITALPECGWTMLDAWPLADRLSALLPSPVDPAPAPKDGILAAGLARGRAALAALYRAIGL